MLVKPHQKNTASHVNIFRLALKHMFSGLLKQPQVTTVDNYCILQIYETAVYKNGLMRVTARLLNISLNPMINPVVCFILTQNPHRKRGWSLFMFRISSIHAEDGDGLENKSPMKYFQLFVENVMSYSKIGIKIFFIYVNDIVKLSAGRVPCTVVAKFTSKSLMQFLCWYCLFGPKHCFASKPLISEDILRRPEC